MFRAHHRAGPVVWCAPNFTLSPNPASLISTMGEFRVYLPRCPLARGVYFVTRLHEAADIFQYHSVRKLWSLALRSSGHSRSQRPRGPSRRRLRWGRCRRNTEPGPRRVHTEAAGAQLGWEQACKKALEVEARRRFSTTEGSFQCPFNGSLQVVGFRV